MHLNQDILRYISDHRQEALDLLKELAQIPAPSNEEDARAAFCLQWLHDQGATEAYIDSALNVIYPIGCQGDGPIAVFMAHSDVVFPDKTPLPLRIEDGNLYCPGIGDDTANVVALLMAAKYIAVHQCRPKDTGVLLVINSGEEGLGNLKGSRKIVEDFGQRIREFVTFDSYADQITHRAVGSKRYEISIETEGGHSLTHFGNRNAIAYLASLIDTLYTMKVPDLGRSSYNVGTISGGTSVNTIAQFAQMRYEIRSDEASSLAVMEQHLIAALELYRAKGVTVTCTQIGDRPCGGAVDPQAQDALTQRGISAIETHYGLTPKSVAASTDCNVPLSKGIPSLCLSCLLGGGAHTREEFVKIDSLEPGLRVSFSMILYHF